MIVPSGLTPIVQVDLLPPLNQKPIAIPLPTLFPSTGDFQWSWFFMAFNISTAPILGYFGPSALLVPSLEALINLKSIGSIFSSEAISSIIVSVANVALVAPGAL